MLNLFYAEPDPDRFVRFDRYPRRILRRLVRGRQSPGGQRRVFLNLCAGLDRIGAAYRVNDYGHARRHPDEPVCIVGKPHVLDAVPWPNPIVFGASVFSHPTEDPRLCERLPVRKILVPGEWMRQMWEPYYGDAVVKWPVGIDTDAWRPADAPTPVVDILLYDKVRWNHDSYEASLLEPIRLDLRRRGLRVREIRYGHYREKDFHEALGQCRAMIFLCEHETQGLAYQQALSCDVPIYAWDRGGFWQDPTFYPAIRYAPVTSVPYWEARCGSRFRDIAEFKAGLDVFWSSVEGRCFSPRSYIVENLTLEQCARHYVEIVRATVVADASAMLPRESGGRLEAASVAR